MTDWECYDPDTGEWYIASVDMQAFANALQDLINEWNLETQVLADLLQKAFENFQETAESVSKAFSSQEYSIPAIPRYPMIRQYSKCKTPDKNLIWKPRVKARSRL